MGKILFGLLMLLSTLDLYAQTVKKERKLSLSFTFNVCQRYWADWAVKADDSRQIGFPMQPDVNPYDHVEGCGINGGFSIELRKWQVEAGISKTFRYIKLYNAMAAIVDSNRSPLAYDFNHWMTVNDLHLFIRKYWRTKKGGVRFFIEISSSRNARNAYAYSIMYTNRSVRSPKGYSKMASVYNFDSYDTFVGFNRRNLMLSLGGKLIPTSNMRTYAYFPKIIPEVRIGYRFKVL